MLLTYMYNRCMIRSTRRVMALEPLQGGNRVVCSRMEAVHRICGIGRLFVMLHVGNKKVFHHEVCFRFETVQKMEPWTIPGV